MTDTEPKRFGVWAVICISAAVCATSAGGGWNVGRSLLQDELQQLRSAKDWKLPELLESLGKLDKQLALDATDRSEFETLKKNYRDFSAKESAYKLRIAELENESQSLVTRIMKYEGDTFELYPGTSHFIIPKILAVGLHDCSSVLKEADVQFGEQSRKMKPGMPIKTTHDGKEYVITLLDISERELYSATARLSISEPASVSVSNPSDPK